MPASRLGLSVYSVFILITILGSLFKTLTVNKSLFVETIDDNILLTLSSDCERQMKE
ncbi:unnamed protein product [Schistosoma margrebowiei]|uniref:Uncharacterized protein n=1 Tax=Schistosoma margrebowiei TaxID=48269 RepID=A0A183MY73_9TREM|nr:unnamed protein product [Schistosoma margrebowiei]